MKKILLAVGNTRTSLETARQIRPWLRERHTSLTLMAVVTPGTLSPLSAVKHTLEHTEAIFTDADEKPGIIVRVGTNPAAELCHEVHSGDYDLLAVGLRGQHSSDGSMSTTCRAVLRTCPSSVFVAPPTLHMGMTSQVLFAVDHALPPPETLRWLIDQCRAQRLNAVLCVDTPSAAAPLEDALSAADIRTQVVPRTASSASCIHAIAQDRHVRWVVLPVPPGPRHLAPSEWLETLLSRATYPVLLVPQNLRSI